MIYLELHQDDLFYELSQNDEVIIYEKDDKAYKKFCRYLSDKAIKINVDGFNSLKNRLLFDFNVLDLPFALYYGYVLVSSDNIKKAVEYINEIKYDLLERKVNKLIYLSEVAVFIEGSPNLSGNREVFELFNLEYFNNCTVCYYNVILNKRLRGYMIDRTKCSLFPQIFINGKFIGDIDKLKKISKNGKIKKIFK